MEVAAVLIRQFFNFKRPSLSLACSAPGCCQVRGVLWPCPVQLSWIWYRFHGFLSFSDSLTGSVIPKGAEALGSYKAQRGQQAQPTSAS